MKYNKLKLLKNAFTVFLVWLLINVPVYSSDLKDVGRFFNDYYKTHDFGDNLEIDFVYIAVIASFALFIWSIIKNARENNRKNQ